MQESVEQAKYPLPGLNNNVGNYILSLKPDIRNHQTDQYWTMRYMEHQNKSLPETTLIQNLKHLGLNETSAANLASLIQENPVADHQTTLYWAKRSLLCLRSTLWPHHHTNNENNSDRHIPIIKKKIDKAANDISQTLNRAGRDCSIRSESHYTYWFHGTSQKAAEKISTEGIKLNRGELFSDFSHGYGFYVTSSLDFAENWATMNYESGAIITFKVKSNLLTGGLELTSNSAALWYKVVRHFRNGCNDNKMEALDDLTYISGPISKNNKESGVKTNWNPTFRLDQKGEPMLQLCLKEKNTAKHFYGEGQNIDKILVLNKIKQ